MLRAVITLSMGLWCCSLFAQKPPVKYKWWVEFTDKTNSPYSTNRPAEFLSARSLERRARANVPILEEDLPVNATYIEALRKKGAVIHGRSRWMNAVTVIADSSIALSLTPLPFVKGITYIGRDIRIKNTPNQPQKKRSVYENKREFASKFGEMGYGAINLDPLETPFLYDIGARGNGIWIAVLDGGFTNTDTIPLFDSVAYSGRLWPGPDLVERDRSVYESAMHGTSVLSVMAANMPGHFVGAAPEATYFLLKTEDTGGEYPVEEANWIAGAEWADSIGVDVINASLGYTSFSDTTLNHRYSQLDGRSTIGSKGASIAARKGMIICNAAGNSGDEPWHYLGVPSDAPGIIAVGATDSQTGKHAPFSSYGPSADGRIKPDLSAPGANVVTAGNLGMDLGVSAGTSIASPILAGSIAALWSAYPTRTGSEILDAVFSTASKYKRPDNALGYGVPNLSKAWMRLSDWENGYNGSCLFEYDATLGTLQIMPFLLQSEDILQNYQVSISDLTGKTIHQQSLRAHQTGVLRTCTIDGLKGLPHGLYVASIKGIDYSERFLLRW